MKILPPLRTLPALWAILTLATLAYIASVGGEEFVWGAAVWSKKLATLLIIASLRQHPRVKRSEASGVLLLLALGALTESIQYVVRNYDFLWVIDWILNGYIIGWAIWKSTRSKGLTAAFLVSHIALLFGVLNILFSGTGGFPGYAEPLILMIVSIRCLLANPPAER